MAKEIEEDLTELLAQPVKHIRDGLRAYDKATKPIRDAAKDAVTTAKAYLERAYEIADLELQQRMEAALESGDHAALADIPDAPEICSGITFHEKKDVKIVDFSAIPREFLVLDEKKALAALKAGDDVEGLELTTIREWRRAPRKETDEATE